MLLTGQALTDRAITEPQPGQNCAFNTVRLSSAGRPWIMDNATRFFIFLEAFKN